MMHQPDQRIAPAQARDFRKHAQGQPIDHDGHAVRNLREFRQRGGTGLRARPRKSLAEIHDVDRKAEMMQLADDPPVIGVAARGRREIARNRESNSMTHRKLAS